MRPKIKIAKGKGEWFLDIIGGGIFLAAIWYLMFSWGSLPEQIPGHYNAAGEVNRWGSRYEILTLPIIGVFVWVTMFFIEKNPHTHNYPARLDENNAHAFYLNSRKHMKMMKNACLFLFSCLIIQTVRIALGDAESLGVWFLPVLLIITVGPIVRMLVVQSKIK